MAESSTSAISAHHGGTRRPILISAAILSDSPAIRHFTIHTWDHLVEERRAGMRAVVAMLAAGKLHPRIHAMLPLAEAARAHELLASGAVLGKLLLRP